MKTVKQVLHYLKRYIPLMVLSLLLAVFLVVFTLYVPILIGRAIDFIVYGAVDMAAIIKILIQVVALVCLTSLFQWIMNMIKEISARFREVLMNPSEEQKYIRPMVLAMIRLEI